MASLLKAQLSCSYDVKNFPSEYKFLQSIIVHGEYHRCNAIEVKHISRWRGHSHATFNSTRAYINCIWGIGSYQLCLSKRDIWSVEVVSSNRISVIKVTQAVSPPNCFPCSISLVQYTKFQVTLQGNKTHNYISKYMIRKRYC